ncbi:uncharacterized protein BO80DRAFT_482409 [Aspergillus ibericus CBS 121593]|uniref:Concanavalin A-like lectin/glucanase n=1 Tax=Aspergillus ibericus CBS 121593 TaxID=1448316 RepID=A0A395GPC9_9EURO|nr:hypothetical protein BO80DRAFT_482409 [Aspergillus ibericus CBS 121593]RAK97355.1 hypothetical protein BO80DRAFT_482409 [Aspergillus ibericus CBS 121593]
MRISLRNPPRRESSPSLRWLGGLFLLLFLELFTTLCSAADADDTYNTAVAKGNALYCLMSNTEEGAQAYMETYKPGVAVSSPWTEYSSLETWGWQLWPAYTEGSYEDVLDNYMSVQLDMDNDGGQAVEHRQNKDVTVDGTFYPLSGARYADVYYPDDGLIVADEIYGPRNNKEIGAKGQPYVKLSQWSDVAWLNWAKLADDVTTLRAVIQFSVSNGVSEAVIEKVANGQKIGGYKAPLKREAGTEDFNALLGTPNGFGVAWLLINHKSQLGIKTIKSVSVFRSKDPLPDGDPVVNMAFEIVDWTDSSTEASS